MIGATYMSDRYIKQILGRHFSRDGVQRVSNEDLEKDFTLNH